MIEISKAYRRTNWKNDCCQWKNSSWSNRHRYV